MSDFPNGLTVTGTLSVAGSEVPTLTSTSTLTNKTLTAPVLANPSYSGTTANGGTVTTIDINGGTIDGTVIGGTTPAAVSATTLSASGVTTLGTGAANGLVQVVRSATGDRFEVYSGANTTGITLAATNNAASAYAPLYLNGSNVALSPVGLAVTGALSATGKLSAGGDTTYDFNIKTAATAGTNCIGNLIAGNAAQSLLFFSDTDLNGQGRISYYHTNDTLGFSAASLERMVLSSSGLTVIGTLSTTGKAGIGRVESATTGLIVRGLGTTAATRGFVVENGSGTEILIQDDAGNLGLGVTPSAWISNRKVLSVGGAVVATVNHAAAIGETAYNVYYTSGSVATYQTNGPAAIVDYNNTASGGFAWKIAPSGTAGNAITFTQAMTLDASGNLLVGAASLIGTERLSVDAGANTGAFIKVTASANVPLALWNSATSGDNLLTGFYTEASPTSRGSITYNRGGGLVAYNTTSDYRTKDVYGPVLDSGSQVDALKVYRGKMKGATMERPMLIAHEAQEVAPYAVSGVKDAINEDGTPLFQQVDTSSLVPLLIAELQSLRARVAQLEGI